MDHQFDTSMTAAVHDLRSADSSRRSGGSPAGATAAPTRCCTARRGGSFSRKSLSHMCEEVQ